MHPLPRVCGAGFLGFGPASTTKRCSDGSRSGGSGGSFPEQSTMVPQRAGILGLTASIRGASRGRSQRKGQTVSCHRRRHCRAAPQALRARLGLQGQEARPGRQPV